MPLFQKKVSIKNVSYRYFLTAHETKHKFVIVVGS